MSSSLYWQPVRKRNKTFDTSLKWALREQYGYPVHVILTGSNVPFLTGLKIGKVKDADKLIEAIEKYGEVKVWEES